MSIKDEFCGYLKVDDDTYAYSVSNRIVTLLPAISDEKGRYDCFERMKQHNIAVPEFFYGNDTNYKIALMHIGKFFTDSLGLDVAVRFSTPVIVKACGNASGFFETMSDSWEKFHAIEFHGGNINALYNPSIAKKSNKLDDLAGFDGAREIKMRPFKDYSLETDFILNREKVKIKLSIRQSPEKQNKENYEAYNLGKLDSFIRFSFENAQGFETIEKYYLLARRLVALLTVRNNVFFEHIYLTQRVSDDKYYRTAECKIFDAYVNYSEKNCFQVISLGSIWDSIPRIISAIQEDKVAPIFDVLPSDNKLVGKISIANVQDLCTAIEASYELDKRKRKKDKTIEELKKSIKNTIEEFLVVNPEIDVYKKTTISSSFKYLDYTLNTKILTLYNENKGFVDLVIKKHFTPPIDDDTVAKFTKLRNAKTHAGTFEWGDSADIYWPLFAMVYVIYLKYTGVQEQTIKDLMEYVF